LSFFFFPVPDSTPWCGHLWAIYTKNNGLRGGAGMSLQRQIHYASYMSQNAEVSECFIIPFCLCFLCRFIRVAQAGLQWWDLFFYFLIYSFDLDSDAPSLVQRVLCHYYMPIYFLPSMLRTTWLSCPSAFCSVVQMMLLSGEAPKRTVCSSLYPFYIFYLVV